MSEISGREAFFCHHPGRNAFRVQCGKAFLQNNVGELVQGFTDRSRRQGTVRLLLPGARMLAGVLNMLCDPELLDALPEGLCGLFRGVSCRHSFWPFIEGVSERTYTGEQFRHIDDGLGCEFEGRHYSAYQISQMWQG